MMHRGLCSQSIAIGGICLMVTVAAGALTRAAHAQQMQQVDGSAAARAADEFYPLWARPYLSPGFNAGSYTANQQAYTTKFGPGTVGIFLESNGGAGMGGTSGNQLGPLFGGPTSLRQDWVGASLANPAWRTSVFGSYKSELNAGLYTTASFGLAGIRTNPSGFSGLTNFSTGNDAVGLTASAGVGVQLTPQISIEGGFTWTQAPASSFR